MSLTLSASLFASAWAAFLLGPLLVGRRRWGVRNPTLAFHAWALLFVGGGPGARPDRRAATSSITPPPK